MLLIELPMFAFSVKHWRINVRLQLSVINCKIKHIVTIEKNHKNCLKNTTLSSLSTGIKYIKINISILYINW